MIRAVGFDLDDTILDHRGAATVGIAALLQAQGWTSERIPDLGNVWERLERTHFTRYVTGELTIVGQRRERMRDLLAMIEIELSEPELEDLFVEFLKHYAKSWAVFDDVLPTLEELRRLGLPMAVLTNGLQEQQEAKLSHLGISKMFDSVLAIGTLTAPKPDPRAYLELVSAFGVEPEEVVYIGDEPHWDALAATKVGLHGIWLNRDRREGPEGIGLQVGSLESLVPMIHQLNGLDG